MNNYVESTNLSAVQFSLESAKTMEDACSHIIDNDVGIINFTYCRTFNNGTRLYLCDHSEWIKHYINNSLHEDIAHCEFYTPGNDLKYTLWTGFKEDKVFSAGRDFCNWWYDLIIYERNQNYIDYFNFISHTDNPQIINYYLNNLDKLKQKVQIFKEKASDLIDPTDKRKLIVSKHWKSFDKLPKNPLFDPHKTADFINKTKIL